MTYLLDTNVVSALRVRGRNPAVERWVRPLPLTDLFLAATTLAELERGVSAAERRDPPAGAVLRSWFESRVLTAFAGRVLPFDLAAARTLAAYPVPDRAPPDDALIAAVAEVNGLTVATRNTRHFAPLGVRVVDPWEAGA